jgi:hypothetical protein
MIAEERHTASYFGHPTAPLGNRALPKVVSFGEDLEGSEVGSYDARRLV